MPPPQAERFDADMPDMSRTALYVESDAHHDGDLDIRLEPRPPPSMLRPRRPCCPAAPRGGAGGGDHRSRAGCVRTSWRRRRCRSPTAASTSWHVAPRRHHFVDVGKAVRIAMLSEQFVMLMNTVNIKSTSSWPRAADPSHVRGSPTPSGAARSRRGSADRRRSGPSACDGLRRMARATDGRVRHPSEPLLDGVSIVSTLAEYDQTRKGWPLDDVDDEAPLVVQGSQLRGPVSRLRNQAWDDLVAE